MIKVVPYPEKPGTLGFGSSSFIFRNTLQTNNKEINIYIKIKTHLFKSHFFIQSEICMRYSPTWGTLEIFKVATMFLEH